MVLKKKKQQTVAVTIEVKPEMNANASADLLISQLENALSHAKMVKHILNGVQAHIKTWEKK